MAATVSFSTKNLASKYITKATRKQSLWVTKRHWSW